MADLQFPNKRVVRIEFDDEQHTYTVAHQLDDGKFSDPRPTHGITTPLEVVPKPYLTPWGSKTGVDAILNYIADYPQIVEDLPQFFEDKLAMESGERYIDDKGKDRPVMSAYKFKKLYPWYSKAKTAYKDASQEGKELGSWLHSSIENYYNSGRTELPVVTPDVEGMWESFTQFDNFFKPKLEEAEFFVYSMLFGYSGQGDFKGTMSGKYCIGDWKSTNRSRMNLDGISVEYFFQLGGLAQAEFERTGKWVDDVFIANFDKKGEPPRVIWASEFGMSPRDCAKAYINCHNTYHTIKHWDYEWLKK